MYLSTAGVSARATAARTGSATRAKARKAALNPATCRQRKEGGPQAFYYLPQHSWANKYLGKLKYSREK